MAADFLRAPDPGPVELHTELLRAGRTASVVAVRLLQDGRLMLTATVTAGRLPAGTAGVHAAAGAARRAGRRRAGPGRAVDPISGVAGVCDLRWDPASGVVPARRAGAAGGPRLGPPARRADRRAVRAAGRRHPPADRVQPGRERGWAPTVQLTALLRAHPAPGLAAPGVAGHPVAGGWFDEDATVLDSTGRLICQARQLALAPRLPSPP